MASQVPAFGPGPRGLPPQGTGGPRLLTVTQLNALIQRILGDHLPGTVHLVGEISNLSRHSSGHLYLTLKDNQGEIKAVMWKSSAAQLKFRPTDGLEVVATGYVDVYAPRGQYQFYINRLEPRGVGSLELAFRQLHEKLSQEGLFDPARKRPIPRFPRTIAVVTSPTGAAIRDILHTIQRRYCCASVLLHPVRVQGEGAAAEIAAAIGRLNRFATQLGGVDVMIVGRGGGSLEDLWAFNEEVVARAIAASDIPIISAVGHEVDVTIADLVADLRAPTPTAAAELACPVLDDVLQLLANGAGRMRRAVRQRLERARADLAAVERLEWFRDPCGLLHRAEQQLDEILSRLQYCGSQRLARQREGLHRMHVRLTMRQPETLVQRERERLAHAKERMTWAMQACLRSTQRTMDRFHDQLRAQWPASRLGNEERTLDRERQRLVQSCSHWLQLHARALDSFGIRLDASSYQRILARGFTITRTKRGRQIITQAAQAQPGEIILTETAEGEFESRVRDTHQQELFE